jgi:hypothetical protein
VIAIVVPVTVLLIAGLVALCCFCAFRHRRARAQFAYNRNSPPGSDPTQPTAPESYSTSPPSYESSFGSK